MTLTKKSDENFYLADKNNCDIGFSKRVNDIVNNRYDDYQKHGTRSSRLAND